MRESDRTRAGAKLYTKVGVKAECFLYSDNEGRPCAAGYSGKKDKPNFRYRYRTVIEAQFAIDKFIFQVQSKQEQDRLWKLLDQKSKEQLFNRVEIGSVFVSSWGYDQTNVDAYQVIEKKGSATLVLREIALSVVPSTKYMDMSCNVRPIKDFFLEDEKPFEKRINSHGIRMSSYSSAYLWDGKSDYYKSWYA